MTKTNKKLRLIAAIQTYNVPVGIQGLDWVLYDPKKKEHYVPTPWLVDQPLSVLQDILYYVGANQDDVANSRDEQSVLPGSYDQPGDGGEGDPDGSGPAGG